MDPLFIVILLALFATVVTMALGLMAMAGGGEVDRQVSTWFMWARIATQAFAVLLLLLALYLKGAG